MTRNEIERLLPEIFRRCAGHGSPLSAALDVALALHAPTEEILSRLPDYFSPHAAPDAFVPLLAAWVDLDWLWAVGEVSISREHRPAQDVRNLSCGLGRVRDLVAAAAELSRWRGTARGLRHFLVLATGRDDVSIEERVEDAEGRVRPYHIRVRAPGSAAHRVLIERIVNEEKPAYVTFELSFEAANA